MQKQIMFRVIAIIFSLILNICVIWLAVFFHIIWAKAHRENTIPIIRQSGIAQHFFLEENYLELITIVSEDEFTTVWDTTNGVSLSKEIFTPTEMYGELKYRYKVNTGIYNVVVWSGLFYQALVVPATPEVKALLSQLTVVYQAYFETDDYGFKKTELDYKDKQTILFLGDSFTEGLWIESKDTFVSLIGQEIKNLTPVNLGVNGYGALEMAWTLEHYGPLLNPRIVVVNLFPNDVEADYLKVIKGEASDQGYQEMFKYLDKILEYCTKNNLALIVSTIPPPRAI